MGSSDANTGELPGLTPEELALLKKMFSSPLDIPSDFKAWLVSYFEANPPEIPFTQLFGYQNFISTQVTVYAATGSNLSAGNNATVTAAGPALSNLPAGKYVMLAGYYQSVGSGGNLAFSPISLTVQGGAGGSMAAAVPYTSSSTFNITSVMTETGGGAGGFAANLWLIAIRYDNA